MAVEDLQSWTEVDEDGDIARSGVGVQDTVTVSTIRRDAVSYLYNDYGAGYFTDFKHNVDIKQTGSAERALCGFWGLSASTVGTDADCKSAGDGFTIRCQRTTTSQLIAMKEWDGGSGDNYANTEGTQYHCTIERNGTTLTCKIYSDSARTTLLDTLSLTVVTDAMRYCYLVQSADLATYVDVTISFIVDELEFLATSSDSVPSALSLKKNLRRKFGIDMGVT